MISSTLMETFFFFAVYEPYWNAVWNRDWKSESLRTTTETETEIFVFQRTPNRTAHEGFDPRSRRPTW